MLSMKPNCECCDKDLPPESIDAMVCSFECTFCKTCISEKFDEKCPNCGGMQTSRPTRMGGALERNPASVERVLSRYEFEIIDGNKHITRTRL